jgi:hypothetical protein
MFTLAYIDPGTGSIILQALIGGILAGLVTIKFYWSKVRGIFVRQSISKPEDSDYRSQG